jgi:hypothetical protein
MSQRTIRKRGQLKDFSPYAPKELIDLVNFESRDMLAASRWGWALSGLQ